MPHTWLMNRRNMLRSAGLAGVTFASGAALPLLSSRSFAQTAQRVPVHITNSGGNLTAVLQEMLRAGGYLERFGLDAKISNVSDGSKLLASLISGSSDVVMMSGFSQVFPAIEKGAKLKIIGGGITLGQQSMFTKRSDIREVKDLVGKTIGVGALGAQLHQVVVALLLKRGISPDRVTFASIGSSADVFRAVAAGTVDAGPAQIDFLKQQEKFGVHTLKDANFWEDLPEYTFQAAYASQSAIDTKREAIVRTLAAHCLLYRYIQSPESKAEFVRARAKTLNLPAGQGTSDSEFQWEFFQKHKIFTTDIALSEERMRYVQELNVRLNVQRAVMPMSEMADMSLAKDALKLVG